MLPTLFVACFLSYRYLLAVNAAVLVDFQVAQPPIVPQDAKQCTIQVLHPPTDCGPVGSWAAITLNLTVTSNGTQYDRLGIFTFQNVEIWRTSTPEPTIDGIFWTYVKDVSRYIPLFATEGTFIFELDNIIETGLNGIYSTVVEATYYASSEKNPPAKKADLIIPISTLANNTGDDASVPPSFSRNITLPTNTVKVFAEILASGNSEEEFWYTNAANAFLASLPADTTYGQGPFREVRLLIDGQLADGNPHQFTIDVVSAEEDHTILQNWYVSGLLQVITDSSTKPTTGKIITLEAPPYAETDISGSVSADEVNITVTASRKLYIESQILSGSGEATHVVWSQELSYSNIQLYSDNANNQVIRQTASGSAISTHNGVPALSDVFSYPLNLDLAYLNANGTNWTSLVDHSYTRTLVPSPLALGSVIKERQIADGFYQLASGGNFGNGTNNNTFTYTDDAGNFYSRIVDAALNVIILDQESGNLAAGSGSTAAGQKQSLASTQNYGQGAALVDFQVAQPPPVPQDAKQCTIQVLQRDFAFSFGRPPTDCGTPGSWAAVTLNFTVTSNGTQFDRLVWRTSTPEPTIGDGIIWTYVKDVTRYIPLFADPGTFILELDNLIEPGLDAVLHATYYASSAQHPPAQKSDLIVPLSTFANDTGNDASVPPGFSLNVTLPPNAVGIFAELYASGNGDEEFWYFNVANEFLPDLSPGSALQQGPFREVRLLVDGQIAGVAYPYATIFTGGIAPPAWRQGIDNRLYWLPLTFPWHRPITSYGALDLPTYFMDLTPFVPIFTDGQPHNITIDVASAETDHAITQNWFVSGLLQVYTDKSSNPTTGNITSYTADPFSTTTTTGSVGENGDVNITVTATRQIHIEAEFTSGSGETTHVVWSQALEYSNVQSYLQDGTIQTASGEISSSQNGVSTLTDTFSYPLSINLTFLDPSGDSFIASFDHSYDRALLPFPAIPKSQIVERQVAVAFFETTASGNTGNGTNNNVFSYSDSAGNTYERKVNAAFNNITLDVQSGTLAHSAVQTTHNPPLAARNFTQARLPRGRGL
ncbi:hypothetical protein H0H92_010930 [Tricholoma furcatifolium]|nr:hypothetical protein H0H92_010930 [Tricholoma furcatifolium]